MNFANWNLYKATTRENTNIKWAFSLRLVELITHISRILFEFILTNKSKCWRKERSANEEMSNAMWYGMQIAESRSDSIRLFLRLMSENVEWVTGTMQ